MKISELKKLKTFKVKKVFSGEFHADNHNELRACIIQKLADHVHDFEEAQLTENDYGFHYKNMAWHKPKIKKEEYGTIIIRSKDYVFVKEDGSKSYGCELKSEHMLAKGFRVKTYDGNYIDYTILDQDTNEGA